jgi:hypothetical protein
MRLLILLTFCSITAFGQNSLHLRLQDSNKEVLPFATVLLKKTTDSSLVKGMNTDENGELRVSKLPLGKFTLTLQSTGFKPTKITLNEISADTQIELGVITLQPLSTELAEVKVTATKPFIEKKLDKTIVNVENSAMAAGNTTMELLERSPGVIVDKDGNMEKSPI